MNQIPITITNKSLHKTEGINVLAHPASTIAEVIQHLPAACLSLPGASTCLSFWQGDKRVDVNTTFETLRTASPQILTVSVDDFVDGDGKPLSPFRQRLLQHQAHPRDTVAARVSNPGPHPWAALQTRSVSSFMTAEALPAFLSKFPHFQTLQK